MLYGIAALSEGMNADNQPITRITAIAHNVESKEKATQYIDELYYQMDLKKKSGAGTSLWPENTEFSLFTHAFLHDEPYAPNCKGCTAAIEEYLDMVRERKLAEAARENNAREAALSLTTSERPALPVDKEKNISFKPRPRKT